MTHATHDMNFPSIHESNPIWRSPAVLAAVATIFAAGTAFTLWVAPAPTATINGEGTDHQSHTGSAILFSHEGPAIFTHPIRELCPLTDDGCLSPKRMGLKPLFINWDMYPRPYPPGALLYALPDALLYAWTPLTLTQVNRFSLVKMLATSLLLVLSLVWLFLDSELYVGCREGTARRLIFSLGVATLLVCLTAELVRFALFGIYDAVAVLAALWAAIRWRQGRPTEALLAGSASLFLHFRALWLLPLMAVSGVSALRETRRERTRGLQLGLSALLLAGAVIVFVAVYPWLGRFPDTNPLHNHLVAQLSLKMAWFGPPALLLVAALLLSSRNWLLCGCVVAQISILALTRQIHPWHELFLIPFFGLAIPRSAGRTLVALSLLYQVEAVAIFHNTINPSTPIAQALKSAQDRAHQP